MMTAVDFEDETVLKTIFKDSFTEIWKENPDFTLYLSELSSYAVDKLNKEPDRLAEERAAILEQTQDLAFHNYKTFIQTAKCSREIFDDFNLVENHVCSLLDKLPMLIEKCNEFAKTAQDISTSRQVASLTLGKHTQLLEILELPQLMDTCVRNGYYDEALELAAYIRRLEKKHSNIQIIVNIVNDVKNSTQLMLNQLIHQLRTDIQLPACLKIIGFLRCLDVFSESELRLKFLQARDSWLQSILNVIPTDDPYLHITKVIEVSRVHLFDIITQYRAVFSDEDPLLSNIKDDVPPESSIFHAWVNLKISQFLLVLEKDLELGVGNRMDSLLGQCMYFGLSFSRVGADFRGLIAPLFQSAALRSFDTAVQQATKRFEDTMQSYTFVTSTSIPSSYMYGSSYSQSSLLPPSSLLDFTPLAHYCNSILIAFNDLRLCTPLSIAHDVAQCLQDSLHRAVNCIVDFHRAEESAFSRPELEQFTRFCHCFAEELIPHFNQCLQQMFSPAVLAQTLGLSMTEFYKLGCFGRIHVDNVLASLKHLLPLKDEEPEPIPFDETIVPSASHDKNIELQISINDNDVPSTSLNTESLLDSVQTKESLITPIEENSGSEEKQETVTKIETQQTEQFKDNQAEQSKDTQAEEQSKDTQSEAENV